MALISDKEAAILWLLTCSDSGRYGYELEKIISDRGMRHWTSIGFSSIYFVLKRLYDKGLVSFSLEESDGQPARKRYALTRKGKEELEAKTRHVLSHPVCLPDPLCLGIAGLELLSPDEAVLALDEYICHLHEVSAAIRQKHHEHVKEAAPYTVDALFRYSLSMIQCREQYVADLKAAIISNAARGG